ncbi:hypothetical protein [Lysobacter sp. CA199]|uniref:hypothetical protein n=1 Tax=Lysobacter sp. CA199 TaxID=3455608 RepID=UPI003F8D2C3D
MPNYQANPNPREVHELTIGVRDAPGVLSAMGGTMQYDVANMDCLPPAESFSGVQTTTVSTFLPLTLKKSGDGTFQGRVALDGVADGDYFGRGVCRMRPVGISVWFKATGAIEETRFIATLSADDIAGARSRTYHYWRGGYPGNAAVANYPDHGLAEPQEFQASLRDELFTITIAAKAVQP